MAQPVITCVCFACGSPNPLPAKSVPDILRHPDIACTAKDCTCGGPCDCRRVRLVVRSLRTTLEDWGALSALPAAPGAAATPLSRDRKYAAVSALGGGPRGASFLVLHAEGTELSTFELVIRTADVAPEAAAPRLRLCGAVSTWDAFVWHGRLAVVSDYYSAPSLQALVQNGRRFGFEEAASFLEQMALALHGAHRAGVDPGPLPPSAVLVLDSNDGRPPRFILGALEVGGAHAALHEGEEGRVGRAGTAVRALLHSVQAAFSRAAPGAAELLEIGRAACAMVLGQRTDEELRRALGPDEGPEPGLPAPLRRILAKAIAAAPERRLQGPGDLWRGLRSEGLLPAGAAGEGYSPSGELPVDDFLRGNEGEPVVLQVAALRLALLSSRDAGPGPSGGGGPPRPVAAFKVSVDPAFERRVDPLGLCAHLQSALLLAGLPDAELEAAVEGVRAGPGATWVDLRVSPAAADALEAPASLELRSRLAAVGVLEVAARRGGAASKLPVPPPGTEFPFVWGGAAFRPSGPDHRLDRRRPVSRGANRGTPTHGTASAGSVAPAPERERPASPTIAPKGVNLPSREVPEFGGFACRQGWWCCGSSQPR